MVEQVSGRFLVAWRGDEEIFGPDIELDQQLFAAFALDPSLASAVRFPAQSEAYGSVEGLYQECREVFTSHLPTLTDADADLVAAYVMSTWVSEALPSLPFLHVAAPEGQAGVISELMACLCRRGLRLQRLSTRELLKLPEGLRPTVVASHPGERVAQEIASACSAPDAYRMQDGRCVRLEICAVLVGGEALEGGLGLTLAPTGDYVRVGRENADLIAAHLLPRLLRFRFLRYGAVAAAAVDVPQLSPQIRGVALWLLAALEGAPAIQARLVSALTMQDEQQKTERAMSIEGVVAEVLLALVHEERQSVSNREIAELAEDLAGARRIPQASAKRVGAIVRRFGLSPYRTRFGFAIDLQSLQIHEIAQTVGVTAVPTSNSCDLCQCSEDRSKGEHSTRDANDDVETTKADLLKQTPINDVHDVHDVHDVRDVHKHAVIASSSGRQSAQQPESEA